MRKLPQESFEPCPIASAVSVIFGRWTAEVLWVLIHDGTLRFTALRLRVPTVTAKVLTQRLRELERDGLVLRTYYPESPPRVEYSATPMAASLVPVFTALGRWSNQHTEEVYRSRAAYTGTLPA